MAIDDQVLMIFARGRLKYLRRNNGSKKEQSLMINILKRMGEW